MVGLGSTFDREIRRVGSRNGSVNVSFAQVVTFAKSCCYPSNPIPIRRNAALEVAVGETSSEVTRVKGNSAGQNFRSVLLHQCPLSSFGGVCDTVSSSTLKLAAKSKNWRRTVSA